MRVNRRQNREDEFVGGLQIEYVDTDQWIRIKSEVIVVGLPMAVGGDSLTPLCKENM